MILICSDRMGDGPEEFGRLLMEGVSEQIGNGMIPAGCYQNRSFCLPLISDCSIEPDRLLPLFDPQTSGGLLIAFAPDDGARFLAEAAVQGIFAVQIGAVQSYQGHSIGLSAD